MMKRKMIVVDVEGTLFSGPADQTLDYASTMWQPMAAALGEEGIRRERELGDKWDRGEFGSYIDWLNHSFSYVHKPLGLTSEMFGRILSGANYTPGAKEFFSHLDRKQFVTVAVSGGQVALVERAARELRLDHGYGACRYWFDSATGLLDSHQTTPCDWNYKFDSIKPLFKLYGLNPKTDWIFIGDGKNDVEIAKKAPVSIAINGHENLKKVVTYYEDQSGKTVTNFYQIAELVDLLSDENFTMLARPENMPPKMVPVPIGELLSLKETNESLTKQNELLSKQLDDEKKRQKKSNQKQNDRKGKEEKKQRQKSREVEIPDNFSQKATMNLSEWLHDHKVVFVGLRKSDEKFRFLKNYHENLIVVSADEMSKKFTSLGHVDFLFLFKGVIGHSLNKKAVQDLLVPYGQMPNHRNKDKIINAMANTLYREFESADPAT